MIIRGFENKLEMRDGNMPASPSNMIDSMPSLPNYNISAPFSNTFDSIPNLLDESISIPPSNLTITPTLPSNTMTVIPIIPGVTKIGYIRYFHAAPFIGLVDIYVNGQLAVSNLNYLDFTDYFRAIPGQYKITIYPSGNLTRPVLSTNITIERNMIYTAAMIGERNNIDLKLISDRPRNPVHTLTYTRFIHFIPNAPNVDIYIDERLVLSDLAYTEVSNYLSLNPGLHSLQLKIAGTDTIIFDQSQLNFQNEQFYSVYIVANKNASPSVGIVVAQEGISYLRF